MKASALLAAALLFTGASGTLASPAGAGPAGAAPRSALPAFDWDGRVPDPGAFAVEGFRSRSAPGDVPAAARAAADAVREFRERWNVAADVADGALFGALEGWKRSHGGPALASSFSGLGTLRRFETELSDLIEKASPSVVKLSFVHPKVKAFGTGFFVSGDGLILTNAHVVKAARDATLDPKPDGKVQVTTEEGLDAEGEIVGFDEEHDLALVRIAPGDKPYPALKLGDASKVRAGNFAVAIGHPFGLPRTASLGIVSGTGRKDINGVKGEFLQTDTAINPGNSGGPLIALDGTVIGINTAIFSTTGANIGIGFAQSANVAATFYEAERKKLDAARAPSAR